jgi:hypothetical protein
MGSWPVLPIFEHLRELGQVSQEEMMRTFNMGIGLIAAIPAAKFTRAKNLLDRAEEKFLRDWPRGEGRAPGAVHVAAESAELAELAELVCAASEILNSGAPRAARWDPADSGFSP